MNFCKSCSFEAISAKCFKRSSLSAVREKYSRRNYSFRPPHTTPRGQPSRCCYPAFCVAILFALLKVNLRLLQAFDKKVPLRHIVFAGS
jgi:hypothetical protein